MVGLRSGTAHAFTGVWVVVVDHRVFVRSWNDEPSGWRRAFLAEPLGTLKLVRREVRISARRVRSEALLEAVDRAYGEKYASRTNLRWVRGLRLLRRRATTTELVPR
jgi:hypothetical protein